MEPNDAAPSPMTPPAHLWIVGTVSLLWNALGCYDYLVTKLAPQSLGLGPDMLAYLAGLPWGITAFWALGVWGSLVGSVLLLMRSALAVPAFAASLVGLAVSQGYQALALQPPMPPPLGMVLAIWCVLVLLLIYAMRMKRAGVIGGSSA